MPTYQQMELNFHASAEVSVIRLPDGEVRLRPRALLVEGSTKDVARVLGLAPRTVRRMVEDGRLSAPTCWKIAKNWRFDMTAIYGLKEQVRFGGLN